MKGGLHKNLTQIQLFEKKLILLCNPPILMELIILSLFTGFGMTETTIAVCFMAPTKPLKKGSVGLPLPNTEMQVRITVSI